MAVIFGIMYRFIFVSRIRLNFVTLFRNIEVLRNETVIYIDDFFLLKFCSFTISIYMLI